MLQLTTNELDTLPSETKVYDGVGRLYVLLCVVETLVRANRHYSFVQTSPADVKSRNERQAEDLKREKVDLEKRLHYLETTAKNSQAHIDQMLKSGGRS